MEASRNETMKKTFDGSTDVKVFLLYFENVATRSQSAKNKAVEVMACLDGDAFHSITNASPVMEN